MFYLFTGNGVGGFYRIGAAVPEMDVPNRTAHAVAVLAFCPGGVDMFGQHFEAVSGSGLGGIPRDEGVHDGHARRGILKGQRT